MDRADAAGRLAELREAIRHHDYAYYVDARPEVADSEYDALRRELSDLEGAFPEFITPDSPTQRVAGQPVDMFRPVEHKVAMLSLDNATTPEDLREFEARLNRPLPGPVSATGASRRSTAWGSPCSTRRAASCGAPPAGTAASARRSPRPSGRSEACR